MDIVDFASNLHILWLNAEKDAVFLMFFLITPGGYLPIASIRLSTVSCCCSPVVMSFNVTVPFFHFVLTDYSHKWDVQSIGIAHLFFIFAGSGYISAEIPAERRAFIILVMRWIQNGRN